MKKIFFALLPLTLTACSPIHNPPKTVAHVNLKRYMGTWYEIASFPAFFQRGCRCTQAHYAPRPGGITVTNRCIKGNPPAWSTARGKAWAVPGSRNSKLKVQFFWPFRGDYWVLHTSPGYQEAVVGTPSRKYLWILARHPQIQPQQYKKLVGIAQREGFDTRKLRKTSQTCPR
jgi:apolipoprotein D and lipocalin family protein